MFADQFDIELEYTKRFAEEDKFVESADAFFSDPNSFGANVTMPFKHDAFDWVDDVSEQAKYAGAVNTIIRTSAGFKGDTTDGYGLVTDLLEHKVELSDINVLLIGAGGAAKGALPALIDSGIKHVAIQNRSNQKAEDLVNHSNSYKAKIASLYSEDMDDFDLIVNATSLSLQGNVPDLPESVFSRKPSVYDMVYQSQKTAFLKHAQKYECDNLIDGLGMLVHQAARSFYLWFDKLPDTNKVDAYLRNNL